MKERLLAQAAIALYSGIMASAGWLLKHLVPFSSAAERFIKDRELTEERLRTLSSGVQRTVVFFCSSAGEYEQALPLLGELEKNSGLTPLVVFFSQSGIDYVRSRGDTVKFMKAPLDTSANWRAFFAQVQPAVSTIVRHEIWPAFVSEAKKQSRLVLMNHSPYADPKSRFKKFVTRKLLEPFNKIYTVSEDGKKQLIADLSVDSKKVVVTGDTKYDRVMQRAKNAAVNSKVVFEKISSLLPVYRRFILGSGWHKDVALVLEAYELLKARGESIQLVICPHVVSHEMIEWIEQTCRSRGLQSMRFSSLQGRDARQLPEILILDKMGILAEFYSWCGMAMVGGGLHHQVHNVLEPASHGLYTCIGPRYSTSHEARELVDQGLIQVCDGKEKLFTWIVERLHNQTRDEKLLSYLESKTGASERIQRDLSDHLKSR